MTDLMDKKYKTYNWNIEVNLQEDALRYEAIRECLSDSMKEDDEGKKKDSGIMDLSSNEDDTMLKNSGQSNF